MKTKLQNKWSYGLVGFILVVLIVIWFTISLGTCTDAAPQAALDISYQNNSNEVTIKHGGGDKLEPSDKPDGDTIYLNITVHGEYPTKNPNQEYINITWINAKKGIGSKISKGDDITIYNVEKNTAVEIVWTGYVGCGRYRTAHKRTMRRKTV